MFRTPTDPHDLTYADAIRVTRRDYARLAQLHDLFWTINDSGTLSVGCCCAEPHRVFTSWTTLSQHIREAVKAERGPKPPPNRGIR